MSIGFRHERIDYSKRFANGNVYINGIEGFWSYAKERYLSRISREAFLVKSSMVKMIKSLYGME